MRRTSPDLLRIIQVCPDDNSPDSFLLQLRELLAKTRNFYGRSDEVKEAYLERKTSLVQAVKQMSANVGLRVRRNKLDLGRSCAQNIPFLVLSKNKSVMVLLLPVSRGVYYEYQGSSSTPVRVTVQEMAQKYYPGVFEIFPIRSKFSRLSSFMPRNYLWGLALFVAILLVINIFIISLWAIEQKFLNWIIFALLVLFIFVRVAKIIVCRNMALVEIGNILELLNQIIKTPTSWLTQQDPRKLTSIFNLLPSEINSWFQTQVGISIALIFVSIYALFCLWWFPVVFVFLLTVTAFTWYLLSISEKKSEVANSKRDFLETKISGELEKYRQISKFSNNINLKNYLRQNLEKYIFLKAGLVDTKFFRKYVFGVGIFLVFLLSGVALLDYNIYPAEFKIFWAVFSGISGYLVSYLFFKQKLLRDFALSPKIIKIIKNIPKINNTRLVEPVAILGEIKVDELGFRYDANSSWVFSNLNLKIGKNNFVLIKGFSGSGKSTLLSLLRAELSPSEGHIFFDGQDGLSLNQEKLCQYFGVILQEPQLFSGTILENILLNRENLLPNLNNLFVKYEIFDEILNVPMGVNTYVSQEGSNLSRYQKIVIFLARALVHKPKIIFLDEILVGLSVLEQDSVCKFLCSLNMTKIMISHAQLDANIFNLVVDLEQK